MLTSFITFILSTNLAAAILLCVAFAIAAIGVLAPLVSFILQVIWMWVDEADEIGRNFFIKHVYNFIRNRTKDSRYTVSTLNCGSYHVFDTINCEYIYRDRFTSTQSNRDSDTRHSTKEEAEEYISRLIPMDRPFTGKSKHVDYYCILVLLMAVGSFLLAIASNFAPMLTVYMLTVGGLFYALRAARRFQKSCVEKFNALNAATASAAANAKKDLGE